MTIIRAVWDCMIDFRNSQADCWLFRLKWRRLKQILRILTRTNVRSRSLILQWLSHRLAHIFVLRGVFLRSCRLPSSCCIFRVIALLKEKGQFMTLFFFLGSELNVGVAVWAVTRIKRVHFWYFLAKSTCQMIWIMRSHELVELARRRSTTLHVPTL